MKKIIAILTALLILCSNTVCASLSGATSGWIQGANENSSLNNVFKIAGSTKTFTLLDKVEDDKYLIAANDDYGVRAFSSDGSQAFDINNEKNIGHWLNNEFISSDYSGEKLPEELILYALTHTWETEPGYSSSETASISCKIALLSKTEVENYVSVLGTTDNLNKEEKNTDEYRFWWTRSPLSTEGGKCISIGFTGLATGDSSTAKRLVRPAMCVDSGFFKNVKLDTLYMGSSIKEILNSLDINSAGYTDAEKTVIENAEANDIVLTRINQNWSDSTYDKNYATDDVSFDITFTNNSLEEHTKYIYWQINSSENTSPVQHSTILAGESESVTMNLPIKNDGEYLITIYISSDGINFDAYSYDICYINPISTKSINKGYAGIGLKEGVAVDERLELLESAGVWTMRQSVYWNEIEQSKGKYNWSNMDNYIKKAIDKGVEVIMPLGLINSLYRTTDDNGNTVTMGSDEEISAFVKYALALAKRYPQITKYEIWNEPNANNFWPAAPNVENYIKMLKAVSTALKSINPDIEIIVGVTSNSEENTPTEDESYWCINWKEFITDLLAEDVQSYYDAVSIHTYYNNLTRADSASKAHIKEITELVESMGGFKKIYMTETGAYSGPYSYSKTEHAKAREIVRQFAIGDQYKLDGTWVYNFVNSGTNKYNSEHNYGSVTNVEAGLRPMKAYYAVKEYLSRIDGMVYLGKTALTDKISAHLYANQEETFLLVYGSSNTYTYTYNFGYDVKKYDLYGNEISTASSMTFDGDPCYVYGISDDDLRKIFEEFLTQQLQSLSDKLSSASHKESVSAIIETLSDAQSAAEFYTIIDAICNLGEDVVTSATDSVATRAIMHCINRICDTLTDYLGFFGDAAQISYEDVVKSYEKFKDTIGDLTYNEDMGTWNIWNYALNELKTLVEDGEESVCVPISGEGYSLDKYGRLTLSGTSVAGDIIAVKILNESGEMVYVGAVTANAKGSYTLDTTIKGDNDVYTASVTPMSTGNRTDYSISFEKSEEYVSFIQKMYYGKILKNERLLDLAREYLFTFGTPAQGSTILADVSWNVTQTTSDAVVTIKNTGEETKGVLIVTAYDEKNVMIKTKSVPKTLEASKTVRCDELTLTLEEKPYKLKVFLWNEFNKLIPIIPAREW